MKGALNPMVIVAIIAVILLWYGGGHGWFTSGSITNIYSSIPAEPANQLMTYNVMLTIQPDDICVGDTVTGTITSNMPNGICSVFFNSGSGWQFLMNAQLNAAGSVSQSQVISTPGTAQVRAVCSDSQGNMRMSNEAILKSVFCAEPPPDDGSGDGGGIPPAPACEHIWNPSESTCATGACDTGTCTFIPDTATVRRHCACISRPLNLPGGNFLDPFIPRRV